MAVSEERRRDALILSRVRRIQRRLDGEHALREAVVPLWCAATAVALHRLLLRDHTWVTAAVAFAIAAGVWFLRMRRRRVGVDEAAVLLDRAAGAGGLLLTRLERPVGAWELELNDALRQAPLPEVRRARAIGLSAVALLFLAVILWIPLPERAQTKANAAAVTRVTQVEARAEALAKEAPLEEGVEAELARLRQELENGRFDAADWEAADHLEGALAQKAAEAAAELARAAQAAEALEEAMQKAQNADGAARERDALEQALMDLEEAGSEGGDRGKALERALAALGSDGEQQEGEGAGQQSNDADGREAGAGGEKQSGDGEQGSAGGQQATATSDGDSQKLDGASSSGKAGEKDGAANPSGGDPSQEGGSEQASSDGAPSKSQVSQLKSALQKRQQQLARAYGEGNPQGQQAQGASSGAQPSQSGSGAQGQGQGDGAMAMGDGSSGGGSSSGSGSPGASAGQQGQPGVGQGGGPGTLRFGNNEVNPDRLAFSPLPEGHGGDEPGELWGLRAVDPRPGAEPSIGARTPGAVASGEAAPGHDQGALLPRNRALIRRYFDSQTDVRPNGPRGVTP